MVLGLFGAALLYADGIITPAISVLSAVEGLSVAAPGIFDPYVELFTIVILVGLFLFQPRGTARVGVVFGPVLVVWFLTLAVLGIGNLLRAPDVLKAVSPHYAMEFFWHNGWQAFLTLELIVRGQPLLAGPIRPVPTPPQPGRATCDGGAAAADHPVGNGQARRFVGDVHHAHGVRRPDAHDLTLTAAADGRNCPSLVLEIPLRAGGRRLLPQSRLPAVGRPVARRSRSSALCLAGQRGTGAVVVHGVRRQLARGQASRRSPCAAKRTPSWSGCTSSARRSASTKPLAYTIGFEPTPVRPLSSQLYDWRFGSGAQIRGSNLFVYGWGQQISSLNGRLIAHDPAEQRHLVDGWRAKGQETLSYTCTQCTANISPEYVFFGGEWNQPYGDTFSGYKRVPDDARTAWSRCALPAVSATSWLVRARERAERLGRRDLHRHRRRHALRQRRPRLRLHRRLRADRPQLAAVCPPRPVAADLRGLP